MDLVGARGLLQRLTNSNQEPLFRHRLCGPISLIRDQVAEVVGTLPSEADPLRPHRGSRLDTSQARAAGI